MTTKGSALSRAFDGVWNRVGERAVGNVQKQEATLWDGRIIGATVLLDILWGDFWGGLGWLTLRRKTVFSLSEPGICPIPSFGRA